MLNIYKPVWPESFVVHFVYSESPYQNDKTSWTYSRMDWLHLIVRFDNQAKIGEKPVDQ